MQTFMYKLRNTSEEQNGTCKIWHVSVPSCIFPSNLEHRGTESWLAYKQGRLQGERLVVIHLEIDPLQMKLRADRLSTVQLNSFQTKEVRAFPITSIDLVHYCYWRVKTYSLLSSDINITANNGYCLIFSLGEKAAAVPAMWVQIWDKCTSGWHKSLFLSVRV